MFSREKIIFFTGSQDISMRVREKNYLKKFPKKVKILFAQKRFWIRI
jgi:hypothetical protein